MMNTTKHARRENAREVLANIYVANLSEYTKGNYIGDWLALPMEVDELTEQIKSILVNDEEYAIHDYESLLGLEISEYEDIYRLNETLSNVDTNRIEEMKALVKCFGYTLEEAIECIDDSHYLYLDKHTLMSDEKNLAYAWVESMGSLVDALGEGISNYFDYEAFGRDLRFDLDMILEGLEEEEKEEYYNMSDEQLADWYIFDILGRVEELGQETLERYFDYEDFGYALWSDYSIDYDTMIAVSYN